MLKYLKQYQWSDMEQIFANNRAEQYKIDVSLSGKLCVVTGCTSGVGLAAAEAFASSGASILMINRNGEKSEALCGRLESLRPADADATYRYLIADFADLSQVHATVDTILRDYPTIDFLVNNAGMHSTTRTLTADGHETVFCVNHLASFLITCRLMETMMRTPGSRIIQVNSQGHRFGGLDLDDLDWNRRIYTGMRSYGASKVAQLLTVWEFADRLAGSGTTINAMHPGAVSSGIGLNNGPVYRLFKRLVVDRGLADPSVAGAAILYLAASPDLAGMSGCYYNLTHLEKPAPHALDREVGALVWDASVSLTGLD